MGAGPEDPPAAGVRHYRAGRPRRHRAAHPRQAVMTPRPGPPAGHADRAVVRADPADLDVLSQVIADAFCDLAPSRWLIADPGDRVEIFPGYFRLYLEDAMASGIVCT